VILTPTNNKESADGVSCEECAHTKKNLAKDDDFSPNHFNPIVFLGAIIPS
jgi:hypothetical protein